MAKIELKNGSVIESTNSYIKGNRGARSNIITTVFKCYTCGCEFMKTIDITKEYPLQCDNCESLENTNK